MSRTHRCRIRTDWSMPIVKTGFTLQSVRHHSKQARNLAGGLYSGIQRRNKRSTPTMWHRDNLLHPVGGYKRRLVWNLMQYCCRPTRGEGHHPVESAALFSTRLECFVSGLSHAAVRGGFPGRASLVQSGAIQSDLSRFLQMFQVNLTCDCFFCCPQEG